MKIMPDGYFIMLIIMSILVHLLCPVLQLISYPYSLTGIILIIVGIWIGFVTNFMLLKKGTSIKPLEVPIVLITSGPFRFTRNPIYLGMTVALLGVSTFLGSLFPFIFPFIFLLIINKTLISIEENKLEKLFGEEYLNYKTKVRRWI